MEARGPCLSSAATQVSWVSASPIPACSVPPPRSAPGHRGVGYHLLPLQETFGCAWAVQRGSGAEFQPWVLCWAVCFPGKGLGELLESPRTVTCGQGDPDKPCWCARYKPTTAVLTTRGSARLGFC